MYVDLFMKVVSEGKEEEQRIKDEGIYTLPAQNTTNQGRNSRYNNFYLTFLVS
jgi:hypothetical protein